MCSVCFYIYCTNQNDRWIEKLSLLLELSEVIFIIDKIVSDESHDKRRQYLLELKFSIRISGKHCNHYLYNLTKSHSTILKNLRKQTIAIFLAP